MHAAPRDWGVLVEILDGKRLVHAHGYRADEHLMLLRLAEEMGIKVVAALGVNVKEVVHD